MTKPIGDKRQAILFTLRSIPKGHVTSYSEVANRAGLPGYTRFVCRVLREIDDKKYAAIAPGDLAAYTPSMEIIPWWRVIRSSGHFAMSRQCSGGKEQRKRLKAEGLEIVKDRVKGPWW